MAVLKYFILLNLNINFVIGNEDITETVSKQLKAYQKTLLSIEEKYNIQRELLKTFIDHILKKYKNVPKDLLYTDDKKFRYIFYDYNLIFTSNIINNNTNLKDDTKDLEVLESFKGKNNILLKELYELSNEINKFMLNDKNEINIKDITINDILFNTNNINLEKLDKEIAIQLFSIMFYSFIIINKILILYFHPQRDKEFIKLINFSFIQTDQPNILINNKKGETISSMIFCMAIFDIVNDKNSEGYKIISQILYDIDMKLLHKLLINLHNLYQITYLLFKLI